MVQTVLDREIELLTFLRNTIPDPSTRGTIATDTFTATNLQTAFTLTNILVKNIISVTVASTAKTIGYQYTVSYGEGSASTIVTLNTGATVGDTVIISYKYGSVFVYSGFQRLDSELPRISIIPTAKQPIMMSIGEQSNGTSKWIYYNCQYRMTIRSRFASQVKSLSESAWNAINLYRQTTPYPYNMIECTIGSINPEDFDNELRLYSCDCTFTIKWQIKFKD